MRSTLVIAALTLGFATAASAQMKEGTVSGTFSAAGTYKAIPIGKERVIFTFEDNGFTLSNGFANNSTSRCIGLGDFTNGAGQVHGICVGTDPDGDQIVANFGPDEKHTLDQKSWKGFATYTTGTGKYEGISGGYTYVFHNDFRPEAEGSYVLHITYEGSYKIPAKAPEATGSTAPPTTSK
jgi:hypothetical protein